MPVAPGLLMYLQPDSNTDRCPLHTRTERVQCPTKILTTLGKSLARRMAHPKASSNFKTRFEDVLVCLPSKSTSTPKPPKRDALSSRLCIMSPTLSFFSEHTRKQRMRCSRHVRVQRSSAHYCKHPAEHLRLAMLPPGLVKSVM